MKELNRVLFCVLNWGLGHASRSTPIIEFLLSRGIRVDIASDGDALKLLKTQFPTLSVFDLPAYDIRYSKSAKALPIKLLNQVPKLIRTIRTENKLIQEIIAQYSYDLIISDNRYGCYSKLIPSVIISHQLNIQSPYASGWINRINKRVLSNFNAKWLPDINHQLSGDLSRTNDVVNEIGWLSSYSKKENPNKDIDYLIALSGPEPQRGLLEQKLLSLIPSDKKIVLVRGTSKASTSIHNLECYDVASFEQMNQLLNRCKVVISRSGYSSLMDYMMLGLNAILIPTPGQTEQEHLAKQMSNNAQFLVVDQNQLSASIFDWSHEVDNRNQKSLDNDVNKALMNALSNLNYSIPS